MLKKTLVAGVVFGLAAMSVQANEVTGYLSGNVGQSDTKGLRSNTDTAYKIAAGLQANQYIALEAQYIDLGKPSNKRNLAYGGKVYNLKGSAETKGLGANLVGTLPLDDFKLFAKVGYHRLETKIKAKGFSTDGNSLLTVSGKEHEWVPSFGAGASYALTPVLEAVVEYERYKDVADAYDVDFASVGLRYNF